MNLSSIGCSPGIDANLILLFFSPISFPAILFYLTHFLTVLLICDRILESQPLCRA